MIAAMANSPDLERLAPQIAGEIVSHYGGHGQRPVLGDAAPPVVGPCPRVADGLSEGLVARMGQLLVLHASLKRAEAGIIREAVSGYSIAGSPSPSKT
jgi:hypothetical protein